MELLYDANGKLHDKAISERKTNTHRWSEKTVTIDDFEFNNHWAMGADLILLNVGDAQTRFHMIEVIKK